MALVIEDGTLVPGATSYIDIAYLRAYAAARGRTVPADDAPGDAKIETAAINAMDVIEFGTYAGVVTYETQTTAFPRYGIQVNGRNVPYDTIPEAVKRAQAEYTLASLDGLDLMPTLTEAPIKREKIGPLETEYETGSRQGSAPVVVMAETLLKPYQLVALGLRTDRV